MRSDIKFVTVGSPDRVDGSINLTLGAESVSRLSAALCEKEDYHLVAVKSTVIPGTSQAVLRPINEQASKKQVGTDFGLCVNPEFFRQGASTYDVLHPSRVIIGEYENVLVVRCPRSTTRFMRAPRASHRVIFETQTTIQTMLTAPARTSRPATFSTERHKKTGIRYRA